MRGTGRTTKQIKYIYSLMRLENQNVLFVVPNRKSVIEATAILSEKVESSDMKGRYTFYGNTVVVNYGNSKITITEKIDRTTIHLWTWVEIDHMKAAFLTKEEKEIISSNNIPLLDI